MRRWCKRLRKEGCPPVAPLARGEGCGRGRVVPLLPAGLGALPWHPLAATSPSPPPGLAPRAAGATESGHWSPRPMRLVDFSAGPAPLLRSVLTLFGRSCCKRHRIGTVELPPSSVQFFLLESFGQMSLGPRLRALIDPRPQAEAPDGLGERTLAPNPSCSPARLWQGRWAHEASRCLLTLPKPLRPSHTCAPYASGAKGGENCQKQGFVCKVGN